MNLSPLSSDSPGERTWTLRQALYQATHQWPWLVGLILLGGLLGWAANLIWPPTYQATVEVYVALNPYRAYEDSRFLALARPKYSNLDDYKNWQMSELEAMIYLQEVLDQTLQRLQQLDPAWQTKTILDLRPMLRADWRSAGTWSFVAEGKDRSLTSQAVKVWTEVVIEQVDDAVQAAQQAILIDYSLEKAAEEGMQIQRRHQQLQAGQERLLDWLEAGADHPADQPIAAAERWQALAIVSGLATFTPAWQAVLAEAPAPNRSVQDYRQWLEQVRQLIDEEDRALAERAGQIEASRAQLMQDYALQTKASLGLSPNLQVQGTVGLAGSEQPSIETLRPTGTLVLVGGILGLLAWFYWLIWNIGRAGIWRKPPPAIPSADQGDEHPLQVESGAEAP